MLFTTLAISSVYYVVHTLAALAFLSGAWLLIDSWTLHKKASPPLFRGLGFLGLSISHILSATQLSYPPVLLLGQGITVISLLIILDSFLAEPFLYKPSQNRRLSAGFMPLLAHSSLFALTAAISLTITLTLIKRVTVHIEKQLSTLTLALSFYSLAQLLNLSQLWTHSHFVWQAQMALATSRLGLVCTAISIVFIFIWTISYVRFRLKPQMFIIASSSLVTIFIFTTIASMYLLIASVERLTLDRLATDVNVLDYSIEQLQMELIAKAKVISQSEEIQTYFEIVPQPKQGSSLLQNVLIENQIAKLTIASSSGEILAESEEIETTKDTLKEDSLFSASLTGKSISSVRSTLNGQHPSVEVIASSPIYAKGESLNPIGVIVASIPLDDAFVDGIKAVTGLDATIFAQDISTASTLMHPDGKMRFTQIKLSDSQIAEQVLKQNKEMSLVSTLGNQSYVSAYKPLIGYEGKAVGMLFVGLPQSSQLTSLKEAAVIAQGGSIVFMLIMMVPTYFVAKYLEKNITA